MDANLSNPVISSFKNEMKKERGSFEYKSDGKIEIVRWNENNVVTLAVNLLGKQKVGSKERVKSISQNLQWLGTKIKYRWWCTKLKLNSRSIKKFYNL